MFVDEKTSDEWRSLVMSLKLGRAPFRKGFTSSICIVKFVKLFERDEKNSSSFVLVKKIAQNKNEAIFIGDRSK